MMHCGHGPALCLPVLGPARLSSHRLGPQELRICRVAEHVAGLPVKEPRCQRNVTAARDELLA